MKKIFIVFCICSLMACTKHFPPILALPTIEINGDDAVKVSAEIESNGGGTIDVVGFCYSKKAIPTLADEQVMLDEIVAGSFSTILAGFKPLDTIYFRAFASNEYGFQYSGVSKITFQVTGPPIVPCSLTDGQMIEDGSAYSPSVSGSPGYAIGHGTYGISLSGYFSSKASYSMSFYKKPANGTYTVCSYDDIDKSDSNVHIQRNDGWNSPTSIDTGGKVYVVENGDGTVTVTFCSLSYNSGIPLQGKVTLTL